MRKVLLFFVVLLPFVANAYDAQIGGIYYNLRFESKTAEVTYQEFVIKDHDYRSDYSGDILVPNEVTYNGETYDVTSIGKYAFFGCFKLQSVIIPEGVTSIGENAFCNSGVKSVTIPSTVTDIGIGVFESSCIHSIIIPEGVKSIGESAFFHSGLSDVKIPNTVKSIGKNAFGYSNLYSVIIPDGVTSIGSSAFESCHLGTINIPRSVTYIGARAFSDNRNLCTVTCYSADPPSIDKMAFDGCYVNKELGEEFYVTLYVPVESVRKYRQTEPWNSFMDIQEIKASQHTLTYIVNGEVYKTVKYYCGESIAPEFPPEKEGYSFSGWEGLLETMPDNDVTVTGTFTINKYKLTYMVDAEEYRSYEIKYGSTITPIDEPTKEGYTFSGWSEIPEEMPAHDVIVTGTFVKDPLGTCAVPTISVVNGKMFFACETEGVTFHYNVSCSFEREGDGDNIELDNVYKVTVYASKEGYTDSEVLTKEVSASQLDYDMNGDKKVNVSDIVKMVNLMLEGE